jgi:hypothetical protein
MVSVPSSAVGGNHEELLHGGHGTQGGLAQPVGDDGHDPPTEHRQLLLGGQGLNHFLGLGGIVTLAGQEGQADGVGAGVGQGESGRLGRPDQEPMRYLHQNPGTITRRDLGAGGTPMGQALEHGEALVHDVVVRTAMKVGHHAHTTGVMFIRGVVKAGGHRVASFRIGVGN